MGDILEAFFEGGAGASFGGGDGEMRSYVPTGKGKEYKERNPLAELHLALTRVL